MGTHFSLRDRSMAVEWCAGREGGDDSCLASSGVFSPDMGGLGGAAWRLLGEQFWTGGSPAGR
jgi:hypothetical protein